MKITLILYKYFNFFCVLAMITLLCSFEMRFSFTEKLLGYYLFWQNDSRAKIGRMWEFQDKNIAALGSIEEVVANLKEVKSQAMNITTFRELFFLIEKEGDIAISKNQFVLLQKNLPSELSEIFFSPMDVLSLFYSSSWDRTFFIKEGVEVEILLVDSSNRVLKKTTIDEDQTKLIKMMGEVIAKPLDEIDEFKNRIYPVSEFFSRLQRMEEYSRSKVFQDPTRLLNWGNKLKRVGISEISRSGWVRIGYELEGGLQKETVVFELNEFLIYEVMDYLNPSERSSYAKREKRVEREKKERFGGMGSDWDDY